MKKQNLKPKAVIFDFDGVLGEGLFYQSTLNEGYPDIYNWIQEHIFCDKELVDNWMRGKVNSEDINNLISESSGIDYPYLTELFEQSVADMEIDKNVLAHAINLKENGKKIAMVTNNMDVFSKITAKRKELADVFDLIINSSDYGMIKKDNGGELYRIALAKLKVGASEALLIDDSENAAEIFTKLGGNAYLYRGIDRLNIYFKLNSEYYG